MSLSFFPFFPFWLLITHTHSYPMPTIAVLNGHAFAAGFMTAMYHDYRIQNPSKGFLCINELEFGVPLESPMMTIFDEKLPRSTFRSVILEAKRFSGAESVKAEIVDAVGGVSEAVEFIHQRKLLNKASTGIYGTMKESMYYRSLAIVDNHQGNVNWRSDVEDKNDEERSRATKAVEEWEKQKAKL